MGHTDTADNSASRATGAAGATRAAGATSTDASVRVLIIAGSDSGGGAGIQADIKTATVLGGFAMTALAALTAQNTQGVQDIFEVSPPFLARQIEVVLDDIGADVIKTGMLATTGLIEAVQPFFDDKKSGAKVVDPVMFAGSGDRLLREDAISALQSCLLARASLVTPNLPEAQVLSGRQVETLDDMKHAADKIMQGGAQAALIKGGHADNSRMVQDLLATQKGFTLFENPRLAPPVAQGKFHGTGCTLATAIATKLAQGTDMVQATGEAIDYVRRAIATATPLGKGKNIPLNHGWPLQQKQS